MFSNIGSKCKTAAKILCWLGINAALIAGVVCIIAGNIGFGIGYIIGGSLVSWLGSLGLYGIGEAAENSAIAANLAVKADMERNQQKQD